MRPPLEIPLVVKDAAVKSRPSSQSKLHVIKSDSWVATADVQVLKFSAVLKEAGALFAMQGSSQTEERPYRRQKP